MTLAAHDTRLAALAAWLATLGAHYGLAPDTLTAVSADASFRRYYRVAAQPAALIAVDAPPPEKCREFVQVAALMAAAGVHTPQVLEADLERGFMLVTDLGNVSYLDVLTEENGKPLMREAIDALLRWQRASRDHVLPDFDASFMHREMELMPAWYLQRHLGYTPDAADRAALDRVFAALSDSALAQPRVFMHRDYMPRNLMIASPNPGVLDFQDAVMGPITYDLASLLRDAFISWDEAFELDCAAYYWENAKRQGLPVAHDFAEFYRALEWMGLQRHLKVLGLFARIHYRDGKPRYLADLPRFTAYVRKVAQRYRELRALDKLFDKLDGRAAQVAYTF